MHDPAKIPIFLWELQQLGQQQPFRKKETKLVPLLQQVRMTEMLVRSLLRHQHSHEVGKPGQASHMTDPLTELSSGTSCRAEVK